MMFIINIKEKLNYIIFGALTTVINILIFYILDKIGIEYKLNTTITNFIVIIFAYITNKIFVFKSKNWELQLVTKEIIKFFLSRIGTYFLDILGMYFFIEIFEVNEINSKFFVSILIIIMNYILVKKYIFNERKSKI